MQRRIPRRRGCGRREPPASRPLSPRSVLASCLRSLLPLLLSVFFPPSLTHSLPHALPTSLTHSLPYALPPSLPPLARTFLHLLPFLPILLLRRSSSVSSCVLLLRLSFFVLLHPVFFLFTSLKRLKRGVRVTMYKVGSSRRRRRRPVQSRQHPYNPI